MTKHYDIEWLAGRFENGDALKFIYFWGHANKHNEEVGKFCFSQWFESPFTVDGRTYNTSEHWMMAQKALLFNDRHTFDKIMAAHKPGEAKDLGRQVLGFDEQTWNDRRFEIVKTGNIHKFNQHPRLADFLVKTGDRILVEASPLDTVWGIGLSQDSNHIGDIYAWRGLNLLGFVLMETRDFLQRFGHFSPIDGAAQTPWARFPEIDPHDMFWRMGQGEDCLAQFHKYYVGLNERQKTIFSLTHPAPYGWEDIYV